MSRSAAVLVDMLGWGCVAILRGRADVLDPVAHVTVTLFSRCTAFWRRDDRQKPREQHEGRRGCIVRPSVDKQALGGAGDSSPHSIACLRCPRTGAISSALGLWELKLLPAGRPQTPA